MRADELSVAAVARHLHGMGGRENTLASPTILWALVPFAALGKIPPGHPFDVLYNYGLRHLLGTPRLPS